jgi:hypothetical protein
MPRYTVTDPETNRSIKIEGDSPPSEQELNEIFSSVRGGQSQQDSGRSIGGMAKNFIEDAGEMADQAIVPRLMTRAPLAVNQTVQDMASGKSFSDSPIGKTFSSVKNNLMSPPPTVGDIGRGVASIPGKVADRAKEILTEPGKAFYEHPLNTALDVTAVAAPFAGGARSATRAIANQMPRAAGLADRVVPKVLSTAFSAPEEALRYRMGNAAAVDSAVPYSQLADELPKTLGKLGEKLTSETKSAKKLLRSDPYLLDEAGLPNAHPKDEILAVIKNQKRGLGVKGSIIGEPQRAAASRLDDIHASVAKMRGETVSERDIRKIVEQLDPRLWGQEPEAVQMRVRGIRVKLDHLVKNQNQDFRNAMVPVAKKTRLLKNIKKEFALKDEAGTGMVPTPATSTKFQSILQDRNTVYQRRMADLKKETGEDYLKRAKDYSVQKSLSGGEANGSRNTLGFATAGAAVGGALFGAPGATLGTAAGGLLGRIVDKRGREIASNLIDRYMKARPNATVGEFLSENPSVSKMVSQPKKILREKVLMIPTKVQLVEFLRKAGGDKDKARKLAVDAGFDISKRD